MNYIVEGLSPEPFQHLFGMTDEALEQHNVKRCVCNKEHSFPDRVSMRDLDIGETALLLNHTSMDKETPYKASHAIFIKEELQSPYKAENEIPDVMYRRMLSLRAFDKDGMIIHAGLASGDDIEQTIKTMLLDPEVEHIDAHNAGRGCFSGRISRA